MFKCLLVSKFLEYKFLKEAKKVDWFAKTLFENIFFLGDCMCMFVECEVKWCVELNVVGEV